MRICLGYYVRTEKDGDGLKARVRVLPRQEPQMPWSCAFLLESGIGGEEHSDAMKMGLHPETFIISWSGWNENILGGAHRNQDASDVTIWLGMCVAHSYVVCACAYIDS